MATNNSGIRSHGKVTDFKRSCLLFSVIRLTKRQYVYGKTSIQYGFSREFGTKITARMKERCCTVVHEK